MSTTGTATASPSEPEPVMESLAGTGSPSSTEPPAASPLRVPSGSMSSESSRTRTPSRSSSTPSGPLDFHWQSVNGVCRGTTVMCMCMRVCTARCAPAVPSGLLWPLSPHWPLSRLSKAIQPSRQTKTNHCQWYAGDIRPSGASAAHVYGACQGTVEQAALHHLIHLSAA